MGTCETSKDLLQEGNRGGALTTLMKCDYCQIIYEGLETDDCPKCLSHFHHLVARYPSFQEEDNEDKKDPKYVR